MHQHESDEAARIAALDSLSVLDTPHDDAFTGLAEAAALVCDVPIALISLLDAERQWFKANDGLAGVSEMPRQHALCSQTVRQCAAVEVPDARADGRFFTNPLVIGEPGVRFYAGVPVCLGEGHCVGSLCVIDLEPGSLSPLQRTVPARPRSVI